MGNFADRMKRWDEQYNDLPRKIQLILGVLLSVFILLKTLKYIWPFLLGLLFAALMKPLVEILAKRFHKIKCARTIATLLVMLLVYGFITFILTIFSRQIIAEGQKLIANFPSVLSWVQRTLKEWVQRFTPADLEGRQELINAHIDQITASLLRSLQGFATKVTPAVASGAWSTVTRIPHMILFIVMTIMSSFYFVKDNGRIRRFLIRQIPIDMLKVANTLKQHIGHAVVQQIKAQILVSCTIIVALVIGFFAFSIDYALLLGVVIGLLDMLPIIGAGTFLIPWALFNLFAGNFPMGIKLAIMYLLVVVVRQTVEPRIVGQKLGLYPLVSMVSMYVGLTSLGFIGLIIAPVAANICKVVLENDAAARRSRAKAPNIDINA